MFFLLRLQLRRVRRRERGQQEEVTAEQEVTGPAPKVMAREDLRADSFQQSQKSPADQDRLRNSERRKKKKKRDLDPTQ